jgi:hypothetical protein
LYLSPEEAMSRRIATPEQVLLKAMVGKPVWDLRLQVRDSREVERPDQVYVTGPPCWHLRVTVRRRIPGMPAERADVVQYGYQMVSEAELLPAEWFEVNDEVQVERTAPYEPGPQVSTADQRPSWLGGQPGTGMGDAITRSRRR